MSTLLFDLEPNLWIVANVVASQNWKTKQKKQKTLVCTMQKRSRRSIWNSRSDFLSCVYVPQTPIVFI